MLFKRISFRVKKLRIFVPVYIGTRLGVSLVAPQRRIKTDGFQKGKFSEFENCKKGTGKGHQNRAPSLFEHRVLF